MGEEAWFTLWLVVALIAGLLDLLEEVTGLDVWRGDTWRDRHQSDGGSDGH